jgi:hypothetical protein
VFRMGVGQSDDVDAADAVAAAVAAARAGLGEVEPAAALVFVTTDIDHRVVLEAASAALPGIAIVGGSSDGEVASGAGYAEDSVTVALFASDTVGFAAGVGRDVYDDPAAACRSALEHAGVDPEDVRLCFALPATFLEDPARTVAALSELLPPDAVIVGGGSAADEPAVGGRSYQFWGTEVLEDAIVLLCITGPLTVSTGWATGWRPTGNPATVTRAEGNRILEVDGAPFVAWFRHFVGEGSGPFASVLLAVWEEGSDDFYLRSVNLIDEETGAALTFGAVPEGATVQLAVATPDEILAGATRAMQVAAERFPAGSHPGAALLVSCAVRKMMLGTRTGGEYERLLAASPPGLPMAGFYAYGEIAPFSGGGSRFLNGTCVSILLGTADG